MIAHGSGSWDALLLAAAVSIVLGICGVVRAADVPVSGVAGLQSAIANAAPGDRIVLAPGTYSMPGNLNCLTAATTLQPIIVRAAQPRAVLLQFGASGGLVEGFRVLAPNWQFEGLDIEGVCAVDSNCEHAFHLAGDADATVIRNNVVRDFNAQIKSNGAAPGSSQYPDDVLVEGNAFFDTRARNTGTPVTKIDVVGGRRWTIRRNRIHDFEKGGGDTISYAAFLKGNSRDGVFEQNLVICEKEFSGGVRVGLSFGGGGSGPPSICEDGTCTPEHQNGVMRNNLILNCPDVGIYLNAASNTGLLHNTLYDTAGIDVRFAASTASIRNNLVAGTIRNRDGGTHVAAGNVSSVSNASFQAWFVAPALADFGLLDGSLFVDLGALPPQVVDDYCGNDRNDGAADIGAIEYDLDFDCDTRVPGSGSPRVFADGFE